MKKRVLIMGAAGRDFHNFNTVYRDNPDYKVICFTATQISGISGRRYPRELAGKLYPNGIPIYDELELPKLIEEFDVDEVVLAYSDLSHEYVMQRAERVLAHGADFILLGPKETMLKSAKPVISVCAVRTGCGKSEVTRYICDILRYNKIKFVVVRHPMPYGVLKNQIWERFESYKDLDKYKCTIEEREEYEPHIERGDIVYAGVDYKEILERAEKEADVIVWDGGNNDLPFYKPDLHIVLVDPHRPGHELTYYPGEANLMAANIALVTKEDTAKKENIELVKRNIRAINPDAKIIDSQSIITVPKPELIKHKKVLVVEDGPTLTHGGMKYGAGTIAAQRYHCRLADPRRYARGSIREIYKKFKLGKLLPAMGYSEQQMLELQATINATPCDAVLIGTPARLDRLLRINKPAVRIKYEFGELAGTGLAHEILYFIRKHHLVR